jgi:hypothetical protein
MLREMLRREIGRVQQGQDPKGIMRDPDHEIFDTKVMESIREMTYWREGKDTGVTKRAG